MSFGTVEQGQSWIGRRLPECTAAVAVNRAMVVNYCGLVEDSNPAFWDDDQSPPGLLMTWSMPPP